MPKKQLVAEALIDLHRRLSTLAAVTRYRMPGDYAKPNYEIFEYPGEYNRIQDGEEWARVRMQSLRAMQRTASGYADARGLRAGAIFKLVDAPLSSQAGQYLIVSTSISVQSNPYATGGRRRELFLFAFRN